MWRQYYVYSTDWGCTPVMEALRSLRQEDHQFPGQPELLLNLSLPWATGWDPLLKTIKKK